MPTVSVIVPAAGAGTRFGAARNKIFERLKGQPLFLRTLEAFSNRKDVVQIQLVVSPADLEEVKDRFGGHVGFMGVTVTEGGAARPDSVRNALAKVSPEADLIAVHDAVRPCLAEGWIDAVFAEAGKTGAAILAVPVHGTVKRVSPQRVIESTAPREGLWEAQTPQVFARELLIRAYARDAADVTDDAQLVERLGHAVHVVPGDPRNVKITTPADLAFAAAVIDTLPKPKPKGPAHPFAEAQW